MIIVKTEWFKLSNKKSKIIVKPISKKVRYYFIKPIQIKCLCVIALIQNKTLAKRDPLKRIDFIN